MAFEVSLAPHEEKNFHINVACLVEGQVPEPMNFSTARVHAAHALKTAKAQYCKIYSRNEQFNDWLNRSLNDICMMTTELPQGAYPYAGVPWFSTAFGRDGIITALECLWINPDLARGVLTFLASTQATDVIPDQDAQPGKILHETRKGEMAALKEIPFEQYYGSVDSTPLFVSWPEHISIEPETKILSSRSGLTWNGRWHGSMNMEIKTRTDSWSIFGKPPTASLSRAGRIPYDAVFHADGTIAEGPIALCEVQGYVYAAKRAASHLARILNTMIEQNHCYVKLKHSATNSICNFGQTN